MNLHVQDSKLVIRGQAKTKDDANKDKLKDPDKISPGQELIIP
jgi:hypothetical protein